MVKDCMKLYTNVWGKVRQSEDNAFFLSTNGKFNVVFYLFFFAIVFKSA